MHNYHLSWIDRKTDRDGRTTELV